MLGLEEKELKTKGSLNGDIKVSLPINTQFWEADVRYEVLEEGKVVGKGTHEELMKTNDIYKEVYTSQRKGDEE